MINKIHFTNCLPFKDTTVTFTPGFNVITGVNGCGKSLLLDTIGLTLLQNLEPHVPHLSFLHNRGSDDAQISLSTTQYFPTEIVFPTSNTESHPVSMVAQEARQKLFHHQQQLLAAIHSLRSQEGKPTLARISAFRNEPRPEAIPPADLLTWRLKPTQERFGAVRKLLQAIQDDPHKLAVQFQSVLSSHFILDGKVLINFLISRRNNPPPGTPAFASGHHALATDVIARGVEHDLAGAADGHKEILFIVAETFTLKEGLILIDEPELHLHPRVQDLMAKYLQYLTTKEGGRNQVIVATHSLSFISHTGHGALSHRAARAACPHAVATGHDREGKRRAASFVGSPLSRIGTTYPAS